MPTAIRTGPSDSLRKYGLRGASRLTWKAIRKWEKTHTGPSRHQRVGKGSQPKSMPAQLGCCRTAPLRPLLLQRADRRKTSLDASGPQRTPHVFASTLFVPLSRFFKPFRWRAKVVGSRAWPGGPWVEAGNRDRLRRLVLTGLQPNPVFLPSVDDQLPYKLAQLIPCSDLGIHEVFFSAKEGSNRVPFSSTAQAT